MVKLATLRPVSVSNGYWSQTRKGAARTLAVQSQKNTTSSIFRIAQEGFGLTLVRKATESQAWTQNLLCSNHLRRRKSRRALNRVPAPRFPALRPWRRSLTPLFPTRARSTGRRFSNGRAQTRSLRISPPRPPRTPVQVRCTSTLKAGRFIRPRSHESRHAQKKETSHERRRPSAGTNPRKARGRALGGAGARHSDPRFDHDRCAFHDLVCHAERRSGSGFLCLGNAHQHYRDVPGRHYADRGERLCADRAL